MNYVEPIRDTKKIAQLKEYFTKTNTRNLLLFTLGINTGLRISDILSLKVNNIINFEFIELKEKKTKKYKKIPITSAFKNLLKIGIKDKKPQDFIFNGAGSAKPITRIQAYRILHNACSKIGIDEKIGTHTLRKTFGYHFYKKTKDIVMLQNILNHSSSDVTKRYIGITQDMIESELKNFIL